MDIGGNLAFEFWHAASKHAPAFGASRFGEARDRGGIFGVTGPIPGGRDHAIPRHRWQSHGKSKTIPTAPAKRLCAGLRGGGRILSQPVSNPNSLLTGKITGNF